MYDVDDRDKVVELRDVPRPDIGAPLPRLLCAEHRLVLAYLVDVPDPAWDGSYANVMGSDSEGLVAIVRFERPYAHMFGPPSDEAFSGHPLASRGLDPYAAFEIQDSSWLRGLERMNAVHPYHDRERFLADRRHFVFAFHDSTFECIAMRFVCEAVQGSLEAILPQFLASLSE